MTLCRESTPRLFSQVVLQYSFTNAESSQQLVQIQREMSKVSADDTYLKLTTALNAP